MIHEIGYAILNVLRIMGLLGIVLFLFSAVNTVCSTVYNISDKKEGFSVKRLFKGIGKTALFYVSSIFVAIAFTILPFINGMTSVVFGQEMIDTATLQNLSGLGVLGVCVTVAIKQGLKAFEGIKKLGEVKSDDEEVTWNVEEE